MKVTVLGGGSFSTPALFEALPEDFADWDFVLVGRSPERLRAVARASTLLAGDAGPRITARVADAETSAAALEDAQVVLIQVRIGGLEGRAFDESFPLHFGLCGDEGLGPGGVSAAWRSWPAIERWLQAIRAHAPTALVLMMSSPVGILVRAARTRFPDLNCVGVCEVPYVALRDIAAQLEVALESIRFGYVGVNHLGWLYSVQARVGGGDAGGRDAQGGRGAWVSDWAHHPGRPGFPSAALIEEWGGIPTKYLRLHFDADTMLASQKSLKTSRASELQGFQNSAWASYATASSEQLQARVAMRSTPWYSHAIVPLLRGLRDGNAPGPFFLSAPNNGHSIGFAADAVLEIACRVTNGAIERMPSSVPPPARIAELVAAFCDHERVATLAVVERDRSLLEAALRLHPWVTRISNSGRPLAPRLAAEILRQDGFAGSVGAHEQGERASGHLVDRAGATLE